MANFLAFVFDYRLEDEKIRRGKSENGSLIVYDTGGKVAFLFSKILHSSLGLSSIARNRLAKKMR